MVLCFSTHKLFFFSSHNLIKHETHPVTLKIDFPFSFSDKEEKNALSGAQRYRQNTLYRSKTI